MKLMKSILLSLLAASSIGSAIAAPISLNESYTNGKVAIVSTGAMYSFLLDISGDFVGGFDQLDSGFLTFRLSDPLQGNEKFTMTFGSGAHAQVFTKNGNNNVNNGRNVSQHVVELNEFALADLNQDGLLRIFMTVNSGGNYTFEGVTLLAEGLQGTPVPEPLTLALMGIALAGVGAARRRK